jgi:hypothetical protein
MKMIGTFLNQILFFVKLKMGVEDVPLDDKAKRIRDLLSSLYSPDPSTASSTAPLTCKC